MNSNKEVDAIWTICVLTIKGREKYYERLRSILDPQIINKPITIVVLKDNKERTIGEKRQLALDLATTEYINFIDDDDVISTNYCDIILNELRKGVDGVGFRGIITSPNSYVVEFVHKYGFKYSDKPEKYGGAKIYTRSLNHLNPIKVEIAKQIGYKSLNFGEDLDYCQRLLDSGLVKSDAFIDDYLYFYQYRPNKKN
jgi:hypothetical protein